MFSKNLLRAVLLGVLAWATIGYTAALTDRVTDVSYAVLGKLSGDNAFYKTADTTAYDTIVSTGSDTLYNKIAVLQGNDYVLVWTAMTGTGSDSVSLQVTTRCFDKDGRYLYSVNSDTITSATGAAGAILLPINSTAIGQKYSVCLTGLAGNGGQVIINRFAIFYRRPLGRMQ